MIRMSESNRPLSDLKLGIKNSLEGERVDRWEELRIRWNRFAAHVLVPTLAEHCAMSEIPMPIYSSSFGSSIFLNSDIRSAKA